MIDNLLEPFQAVSRGFSAVVKRSFNNPAIPLTNSNILKYIYGESYSSAGVVVNLNTALGVPAIWRGVNLLANDVAKLPCFVYRRLQPAGKEEDPQHPAFKLVHDEANPFTSASDLRRTMMAHRLLSRGGYAWIERNGAAEPIGLWLLNPQATYPFVTIVGRKTTKYFATTIGERQEILDDIDVLHIKGLSWDGLCSLSILDLCKEAIGLPIARQRSQCKFYSNGMRSSGILMFPGHIDEEAQTELLADFEKKTSGLDNTAKTILMEDGVKYQQLSITAEDAQMIESAKFDNRQIALLIGIPVHKLGDTETTSYNSLEQQNQGYLDESLDPILCDHEAEYRKKLLREAEKEKRTHLIEFRRQALLRANATERTALYAAGRQWGWLNVDDIRSIENMNPLPDGLGQEYLRPMNMLPAGQEPEDQQPVDKEPQEQPEDEENSLRRIRLIQDMIDDCRLRMFRRLALAATKAARKPTAFLGWIDAGMVDEHMATVRSVLNHPVAIMSEIVGVASDPERVAKELFGEFRDLLQPIVNDHTPLSLPAQVREAVAKYLPEETA